MSRWIDRYEPEDETFWESKGRFIALRNLVYSILAEHLGFCVWMMWSVTAPLLPKAGFAYTTDQLFTLVAVPPLVGAFLRIPYTLAVPRFGGRNWTVVSALLLLIPSVLLAVLVQRPDTPFTVMLLAAATAGFGGGNFASSMANISFFYPDRRKGFALGLNAAGGNLGVTTVQLLVPLAIAFGSIGAPFCASPGSKIHLENAGLFGIPIIVVAALGAWRYMDNLTSARAEVRDQLIVATRPHTWIISILYVATFGSFVGYSAALPLLLKTQFAGVGVGWAWTGSLVGAVARPLGGKLADRLGGARVTVWNFGAMALAMLAVGTALRAQNLPAFLGPFLVLFVTTGIGNGSTFRMIPVVFRALHTRGTSPEDAAAQEGAMRAARRESAAVIGFTSAVGAVGGYLIPRALGASIKATGGMENALVAFFAYYVLCLALTWWFYRRRTFLAARLPSLAPANA